jgi:NADPH-dependent glutamate synthase beta subunit-like oxidoreductase/glutamate synthase domain-containing protein 3/ferredoxin
MKNIERPKEIKKVTINGQVDGRRVSSRMLEERIQRAVESGAKDLVVTADGQHGIGGRIWPGNGPVNISVQGPVGQRLGSMGMFGTDIVVEGGASDDVGWINCGAKITVLGDVTNGAHNAAAQGVLYVQGGGGARCDTMTKRNPRFEQLQSWYFRDVGDSFAEFKAGGTAVVCGVDPRNPDNILGYRPCVGMVGGTIYFHGPVQGYSEADVKLADLTPQDWEWLTTNMKPFLDAVDRSSHYEQLTESIGAWKKLIAYTPEEKAQRGTKRFDLEAWRTDFWEKEVGAGGIFGPYLEHERTILPFVPTGENRRFKPVWNNAKYSAPCAGACPSGIPTQQRTSLIRQDRYQEALDLVLEYSPFPGSVCGEICPNLCMDACTRAQLDKPLDIKSFGSLSLDLPVPAKAKDTGKKVAVIGGGPGGLSAAWQLALKGHSVDLYEADNVLGGKLELCIPRDRLPQEILRKEIARFEELGVKVHLGRKVDHKGFDGIYDDHEIVIVACGAHTPRKIPFAGSEHVVGGVDFLKDINRGHAPDLTGQDVIIIGAGNVGMDMACQAYHCGAKSVTAVDIQAPASFGKEREAAERLGTKIAWPKITERYDAQNKTIHFKDGTSLPADTVLISIGETPELEFLPPDVDLFRGHVAVNDLQQTTDVKVFAIGDAVKPGLVTHAIGAGRRAAEAVHALMMDYDYVPEVKTTIPYDRINKAYYEALPGQSFEAKAEANRCMSCGLCRDCAICVNTCYWDAISRVEAKDGSWEYVVDESKCIGCGFCAGTCPCGVWEMDKNL